MNRFVFALVLFSASAFAQSTVQPFAPGSPTYAFSATSSDGAAKHIVPTAGNACQQYLIANNGTAGAWVNFGTSSSVAVTIPSGSTTANAVYMRPGTQSVVTQFNNAWVNAKTASGSTTLYFTCGNGEISGTTDSAAGSGSDTNVNIDSVTTASFTNRSSSMTVGGTAQTLEAINLTRKRIVIENPCSATSQGIATAENLFINFTNAASTSSGNSIELVPCGSYDSGIGPVTTELISVNAATTAHQFTAKVQ